MEFDTISVRLLGGFSVRFGDRTLESLPPQAVSLLSFLIVHRDRPQTRDLLAGRFWSELSEDRARKRLSNSLWQIKNACIESEIPELLISNPGAIHVTTEHPITVDSEEFERQLTEFERDMRSRQVRGVLAERLAELIGEYPGDFLSGHYHDWIEPERVRIRDQYQGALNDLVQLHKSRSSYDLALRFATILVKQEPLREDLHREVMRLHALLGQTLAAERQFEACVQELDAELGVEPSAETVALIERIRTDAPSPVVREVAPGMESSALVGRRQEMGVLLGRADELLGGVGGVVLVEGDPGIGKTRLIEEFLEGADWRGVRILRAGHNELSKMKPYETLRDVLSPTVTGLRGEHLAEALEPVWLQQAAEVLPELGRLVDGFEPSRPLRPEEEPTRMSEALSRVILAQGGLGPTLIVLEDIHWCDDDSMQVLAQLGTGLARSGVLLCLTYRRFEAEQSDSVWSGISRLEALPSASRLVVGPLSNAEVRELVTAQLGPGGLPHTTVSQLVGQTEGNPLYVLESVRNPDALLGEKAGGDGSLDVLDLPASVARSLEARISSLDPAALSVLQGLAALAEPSSSAVVSEVSGVERRTALETLTRMADSGFLDDDADGICRFSHDQTRRAVYEMVPPDERPALHERIYLALDADEDERPERLAHHARLANRMADARSWYLVAAREALAVNGYRTAADHFGRADEAAQELGVDLADRAIDLLACEAALDVLGRRSDQTMLLKNLREVDLPFAVELELVEREVWLLFNTDQYDEGARLASRYVERAEQLGEATVGLQTAIAVGKYRTGDYEGAIESGQQALGVATDTQERIAAETVVGKALVDVGEFKAGEDRLARAAANAELCGDYRGKVEALSYRAVAHLFLGRFQDADQLFTTSLELSRSIGYRWGEGANLGNLAALHTRRGQGGLALDFFNAASEVFGSLDDARGEAFVKLNSAELNHYLLGDDVAAAELANSAAVYFRSVGDQGSEAMAICVHSSVDARKGNRRLARRRLTEILNRVQESSEDVVSEIETRRAIAVLELGGNDWRAASAQLDKVLRLGEDVTYEGVLPNALACRALSAAMVDDHAKAEEMVERALTVNRSGVKFAHLTAWISGRVLGLLGDEERSTEQYKLAYDLLDASLHGLPPELVAQSWSAVPEHVQVAEEYQRRVSITVTQPIPASDAPMGRPLKADEFVDVVWTTSHPSDWDLESAAERRQQQLCRLAGEAEGQGGSARIMDFAQALGVSERTIKRDIAELRSVGITVRTRKSSQ